MRKFILSAALVAGVMTGSVAYAAADQATATAQAEGTGAEKPAAKPEEDLDRVVCKREHVVGSNRPQKGCMTVRERERLRDASIERARNGRGADYNTEIGGPGR
jgi:hypothetical protein